MSYIPTFTTRYLRDCVEGDRDPRRSLDAWMMQQQGRVCDGVGVEARSNRGGMRYISPSRNSLHTVPPAFSPKHSTAPLSRKDAEPFISQISPIFRELIGGHATGEIEPEDEDEQGDRKVHGFVYTKQGKRRTVFRGGLPEHKSLPIPMPKPERSSTVSLPETNRPEGMVRTYKVPRMRRREKIVTDAQEQDGNCKLCATYAQLRRCEVVRAVVPDIPLKCGPCLRKEVREQNMTLSEPSGEPVAAGEPTIMPTPRLRLTMKKRPLEVAAGEDQMVLQMLADVQRYPKRVRKVPGRLLEV